MHSVVALIVACALWNGFCVATPAQELSPLVEPSGELDYFESNDQTLSDDALAGGGLGDLDALLDADLDQLVQTEIIVPVFRDEVTSVARHESTVGRSPAAIYVISGEMIRRSGARNVPEALRLAPGVQVARIDANKWAITIRGFNQRFANKLLVQIDGRTVYTPLFAGVFWDAQDVLLEDVARIEIIRGPGATVWGANAVNGVVNIITKNAGDTQGGFVEAGSGNERRFASARLGGATKNGAWRVYGKWFERGDGFSPTGSADDDWRTGRLGFRSDWEPNCWDKFTLQGDYYDGNVGERRIEPLPAAPFLRFGPTRTGIAGGNALFRWRRTFDEQSDWSLQLYYDKTERAPDDGLREDRDTFDLDFQKRTPWREYHSLIWGFGYRNTKDRIRNSAFQTKFLSDSRTTDRISTFVQDEMTLIEDTLLLTAGSKFSWNDFTGFEYQPTARLLYTPTNRQTYWGAISRAVRVPSRSSSDVQAFTAPTSTPVFPTYPVVLGNPQVSSEQMLAFELGARAAPSDDFFWDLAVFFNHYEDLHGILPGFPGPLDGVFALPLQFVNGSDGETYGFELAATWNVDDFWTLRGAYSFLRLNVDPAPGVMGVATAEGQSPRNQFFVQSSWDLGCDWEFDLVGRYSDKLSEGSIPAYFEMDTRLAWRPTDIFELAFVGRNLLDKSHPEFATDVFGGVFASEVHREVYGMATLRY